MPSKYATFTKPWTRESPEQLGELFKKLGFDAMEFCVREGYQVQPNEADTKLPAFKDQMKKFGVEVIGIAGPFIEPVFAGCKAAGIPFIRTPLSLDQKLDFNAAVENAVKKLEPALRLAEKYGVKIGIQNHYGSMINDALGLKFILEKFPKNLVGAIWDSASGCLAGEYPEHALSLVIDRLVMVNLKNAYYTPGFERVFCSGRQGMAKWPVILPYLKSHGYSGPVCLAHEYTDQDHLLDLLKEDLAYAKSL